MAFMTGLDLKNKFRYVRFFDFLGLLAFGALTLYITFQHEPWSDEAQPWLIARDASLSQLVWIMLHNYDRHPFLWYALLTPFAKSGFPYFTMQIITWLTAFCSACLILFK